MLRPPRTRSSVEATRPGPLRSVDKNADLTSKQQHLESFKPARKTNTAAARTGASVDELRRAGTGIRSRKTLAQLSPRTSSRILAKQIQSSASAEKSTRRPVGPSPIDTPQTGQLTQRKVKKPIIQLPEPISSTPAPPQLSTGNDNLSSSSSRATAASILPIPSAKSSLLPIPNSNRATISTSSTAPALGRHNSTRTTAPTAGSIRKAPTTTAAAVAIARNSSTVLGLKQGRVVPVQADRADIQSAPTQHAVASSSQQHHAAKTKTKTMTSTTAVATMTQRLQRCSSSQISASSSSSTSSSTLLSSSTLAQMNRQPSLQKQPSNIEEAMDHSPTITADSLPRSIIVTPPVKTRIRPQMAPKRAGVRPLIPPVPLFEKDLYLDSIKKRSSPKSTMEPADPVPDMDIDMDLNMDMDTMQLDGPITVDPCLVSEYQEEIFAYKRMLELKLLPDPYYMDRQLELTWQYRAHLMEWLIEVHSRFDLLQETLHLCANYLDRFLSKIPIPIDQLQLAGTVALLLASKYEEIQSPAIQELSFLGGNAYTPARIRQAEIGMLTTLNYDMGAPGPLSFLRRISATDNYDVDIRTLAKYLVDITVCDHRFIGIPASMKAALGYCTARRLLFRGEWSEAHTHQSGYEFASLREGVNVLLAMLESPLKSHSAIFEKYKDEHHLHSSLYVQQLGLDQLRQLHC